jgi:hypothetical protein
MIADLPQLGTMFSLVSIAGKLLEVADEVLQAATVMAGHQEVAVVWHQAVGVQERIHIGHRNGQRQYRAASTAPCSVNRGARERVTKVRL